MALGDDHRSGRVEAHAALILRLAEQTPLAARVATLWRFLERRRNTQKKAAQTAEQRNSHKNSLSTKD